MEIKQQQKNKKNDLHIKFLFVECIQSGNSFFKTNDDHIYI